MMKLRRTHKLMLGITGVMLLLNLLARLCRPAADWYIAHIFPFISGFWCRISGLFPCSVGEWMLVLAVGLVIFAVTGVPLLLLLARNHRKRIGAVLLQIYGWTLVYVCTVATTRFLVLYQGTQRSEALGDVTYSNADVLSVYRTLVQQVNTEAALVACDETGHFVMTDNLMQEAKACMERLGAEEPQFSGYYPDAKPIYHAYFFSQQNLLGIYYPHSMEANYNPVSYDVNLPVTICHEFTHLKGNIFEDEAGYYAFRACMTSESHDFRYSGLISALEWLELDFGDDADAWAEYNELQASLSAQVWTDLYTFVPEAYWQAHQETDEVIPTAIVNDTAELVMDTSLKVNGISEGTHSYHGMTALLLHEYLG